MLTSMTAPREPHGKRRSSAVRPDAADVTSAETSRPARASSPGPGAPGRGRPASAERPPCLLSATALSVLTPSAAALSALTLAAGTLAAGTLAAGALAAGALAGELGAGSGPALVTSSSGAPLPRDSQPAMNGRRFRAAFRTAGSTEA